VATLLNQANQLVREAAQKMILHELYRSGTISSGRSAEMFGMPRLDFI
jgi:hypothetical protein